MTSSTAFLGESDVGTGSSSLALILTLVFLVWLLTAALLGLAARRHWVTRRIHCPLLRRDVDIEGDESEGRLLDVRRCTGLDPARDFSLCGRSCLDPDGLADVLEEPAHSARG